MNVAGIANCGVCSWNLELAFYLNRIAEFLCYLVDEMFFYL